MNIALFTDAYLPSKTGVVTVVSQLYECLKAKGHHVIIITVANTEVDESLDDPNVYRVPSQKVGFGMKDQFFGFPFLRKVSRILKKNNIEIIHCHTEFSMGINAIHEGRKCKIPVICTTHTMWEDYYKYYIPGGDHISPDFIRFLIRQFYRHMYGLINVSEKAHDYFKQDFICPEIPSAIIPNAISPQNLHLERFTPEELKNFRNNLGIADDEKMILYVGRVVEEKRVLELVDVLEDSLKKNSKAKAVIVGDGAALKHMQKLSSVSEVSDRFIYTGFIDNSLVHQYYEAADLFVTASMSEMHSMTILEALTFGLPIVVRKDSSYNDTVINEFDGYQAETDEEMVVYINKLLNDEELCNKFSENGIKHSVKFMPETFVNRHIAYYKTVLEAWKNKKKLSDAELEAAVQSATDNN